MAKKGGKKRSAEAPPAAAKASKAVKKESKKRKASDEDGSKRKRRRATAQPRYWRDDDAELIEAVCEQIAKSEHAEEKYSLEDMDADINWKLIDEDRAEELQQRWEQITSNMGKARTHRDMAEAARRYFEGAKTVGRVLTPGTFVQKTKPKDEDKPKRPANAYFLWARDSRDALMKKKKLSFREATVELGKLWKTVDKKTKAKFDKKAAELKKEYDAELEEYYKTHPDAKRSGKYELPEDAPKKVPANGFMLYRTKHNDDFDEDLSMTERMSAVSKQWKELSESEREKYNDEAHESYAAFVKEAEEYLKDLESDDERAMAREALLGKRRSTPAAKAAAKKKKSSKPKAPKKPTAQSLYMDDHREKVSKSNPQLSKGFITQKLKENWKAESKAVKEEYKNKQRHAMTQYAKDLVAFQVKTDDQMDVDEDGSEQKDSDTDTDTDSDSDSDSDAETTTKKFAQTPKNAKTKPKFKFQLRYKKEDFQDVSARENTTLDNFYRKWKNGGKSDSLAEFEVEIGGKQIKFNWSTNKGVKKGHTKPKYELNRVKCE